MKKSPVHTTICYTCLRKFSEAEATKKTRKLWTQNPPFHDQPHEEALLEEAAQFMHYAEAATSMMESCEDTCPDYLGTVSSLVRLLTEEAQHRLTEVKLMRAERDNSVATCVTLHAEGR